VPFEESLSPRLAYPSAKIIVVSYTQDLAEKLSNDTRRIMLTPWYRRMFPATQISDLKNSANNFETTAGGGRFATSVNDPLFGLGADYLILDDPEKPTDMDSEVLRAATKRWFGNSAVTRLNNPATGVIIVATHRVHEDDLSAHLLEQGDGLICAFRRSRIAIVCTEYQSASATGCGKGSWPSPSSCPKKISTSVWPIWASGTIKRYIFKIPFLREAA
jgi:hypothetical protein